MKILGISAFYHNSACTLINNGELICAVQEEVFTRKKHDSSFPVHSIKFCLSKINSNLQKAIKQINYIVFYDKPFLSFERLIETYLDYAPMRGFHSFRDAMYLWLGKKLNMRSLIRKEIKNNFSVIKKDIPEILFNYHHLSHASSAFYPSPYEKAAILCLDSVGEWATTSAWIGEGQHIKPLWQINFPHSLGLFYSTFTNYCGFRVNSGEYKLMGLAPYGNPTFFSTLKDNVIDIKDNGSFNLNMDYFDYPHSLRMSSSLLHDLLKKAPRKMESKEIDIHYMDVSSSVQKIIEEVVVKLAKTLYKDTKIDNLCMAGGVALNCVANSKVLSKAPFKSLWVQPAAGDAGSSLGAALSVWHEFLKKPRTIIRPDAMKGTFLGPSYSSFDIDCILSKEGAIYKKYTKRKLVDIIVNKISKGKVVGLFQGALEFGPRALGHRSILGDPRIIDMNKRMNQKIKFRESFRPFAIGILEEKIDCFFDKIYSPYMLLTSHILKKHRKNEQKTNNSKGLAKQSILKSSLPSCTHVDHSCRIQTVGKDGPEFFRKLLEAFYKKTSCPGLINTSFNVRGEPMVCSPFDAFRCFMNTDMDICIINDFLLRKDEQKNKSVDSYFQKLEKD